MNTTKNIAIAILSGLLVLTLSTPISSAGSSDAKSIEYSACLVRDDNSSFLLALAMCKKYRP